MASFGGEFFYKLKHFRRLAMRFEKTDVSYAVMIHGGEFSLGACLNVNRPLYLPKLIEIIP